MDVNTPFRDARYDAAGTITADILHPVFGWAPFTASPDDVAAHGRALFMHISSVGPVAPYVPPPSDEPSAP
jgi:hypothetical protein